MLNRIFKIRSNSLFKNFNTLQKKCYTNTFEFINKTHTITTLKIINQNDEANLIKELSERLGSAPSFYHNLPIILEYDKEQSVSGKNLKSLIRKLRKENLIPVGIINTHPDIETAAEEANIPLLSALQSKIHKAQSESRINEIQVPKSNLTQSIVIDKTLRSGQQFYAKNTNLVILGSLNSGAEAVADGDITVMGTFSGRALAGASGNANAKIYCSNAQPELVSIANYFMLGENIGNIEKPTVFWLENNKLQYSSESK